MGFPDNTNKNDKFYKKKLQISLEYQRYLYSTLEYVLEMLNEDNKGKFYAPQDLNNEYITKIENNFLENFLGISFFRIPEFRKEIISTLEAKFQSYNKQ